MYRGSSFLLQKDYNVHRDAIVELTDSRYSSLRAASCETLYQRSSLDLLFQLVYRLSEIYVGKRKNIDTREAISDTLITKILMGTLGCVPAYDTYFRDVIGQYKVASRTFSPDSIRSLARFYINHKDEFEACRTKINIKGPEYPPMKILDMAFWQIGFEQNQESKKQMRDTNDT